MVAVIYKPSKLFYSPYVPRSAPFLTPFVSFRFPRSACMLAGTLRRAAIANVAQRSATSQETLLCRHPSLFHHPTLVN